MVACWLFAATAIAAAQEVTPPRPVEFQGWRIEAYGPVEWTPGDNDIQLGSTGAPGGLHFRRELTADTRYRLTVAGTSLSGVTTVRVTADGDNPEWFPAPDGSTGILIGARRALEVVVYSDTPYLYRLHTLQLEECADCLKPAEVLARAFQGWQIEPYGSVEWVPVEKAVQLASTAGPGGLAFKQTLTPTETYRVTIDGTPVSGQTTLRFTAGQAGPQWYAAPDGGRTFTVWGRDAVELVVYSDTPYAYRLQTLTVEPCATCVTDETLKNEILGAVPGLKNDLTHNRLAAAHALLNWTANAVVHGYGDVSRATTHAVYEMSAAQAYQDVWARASGGTSCGGFASFFAKLLSLFEFEAFTIDMGFPGSPVTHVTTVVSLDDERGSHFYIFDPTFNGAYVDRKSGSYAFLAQVLDDATARRPRYEFRTAPIKRDLVFASGGDTSRLFPALSSVGYSPAACTRAQDDPSRKSIARVPRRPRTIVDSCSANGKTISGGSMSRPSAI